jgi:hypothetical protein
LLEASGVHVAGAVSCGTAEGVDNALLYASLERKVAERTAALEEKLTGDWNSSASPTHSPGLPTGVASTKYWRWSGTAPSTPAITSTSS